MDISYEEAMRRIDEYEKKNVGYKCCRETGFPYNIELYRGEGQILVVPFVKCIFWYGRALALYCSLNDSENALNIGKTITEAFDYLKRCPVDTRTAEELIADSFIMNNTTCKTYEKFIKKYSMCFAVLNEDGTYIISASERDNKGYGGLDDPNDPFRFKLPKEASEEEIGNAVIAAFNRSDELERAKKPDPYPPVEVELLSDQKLEVYPPRDRHFSDSDDCGAAELYKGYGYFPKEGADSSAEFYLGIAAELDCDMSEGNIRKAWEKLHGKAEFFEVKSAEHGIFKLRAEMKNKSVHRISYLLQIDESELLDCTMELHKPNTRKKLDEKLTEMFEEFARKCSFKD